MMASKMMARENKDLPASLGEVISAFKAEGFALIVFSIYFIFEYLRLHDIYPWLSGIPIVKSFLILALITWLADKKSSSPPLRLLVVIAPFSLVFLLSAAYSFESSASWDRGMEFFNWILLMGLISGVANSRVRLFLIVAIYFLCNVKMAQHGFISWATRGFGFASWGVTGSPGWFANSGEFGMQMAIFVPLVVSYWQYYAKTWSGLLKGVFALVILCSIGSIVASSSRGAVLALGVLTLWYLQFSFHKWRAVLALSVLFVVVSFVMPSEFKSRFESAGEDNTSTSRLEFWSAGRDLIADHPWLGVGPAAWSSYATANYPELLESAGYMRQRVQPIHNSYLEAGTEMGIPGVLSYAWILIGIWRLNRETLAVSDDQFLIATAVGLNGGLIAWLVASIFMSVLFYPVVWVQLGLALAVNRVASCSYGLRSVGV